MAKERPPQLMTVGIVAGKLRVSMTRIQYVLRSRPHIKPAARAGNLRLFDQAAVAMIRHELNAIEARRPQRGGVA